MVSFFAFPGTNANPAAGIQVDANVNGELTFTNIDNSDGTII